MVDTNNLLCKWCGEPYCEHSHGISEAKAKTIPEEKCPGCQTETFAICVHGAGDFFYICKRCGRKWSNIEEER